MLVSKNEEVLRLTGEMLDLLKDACAGLFRKIYMIR
jgi:hypothetical protein